MSQQEDKQEQEVNKQNQDGEMDYKKRVEELEELIVLQQEEVESYKSRLKEVNEVYLEFKQESEGMEQLLSRQVEVLEEQLSTQEMAKANLEKVFAEQLTKVKDDYYGIQKKKDELIEALKEEISLFQKQMIEEGYKVVQEKEGEDEKNGRLEVSEKNVQRLNLELNQKNKIIDELKEDIDRIKTDLQKQHLIFKSFNKSSSEEIGQQQKSFATQLVEKEEEIKILNDIIRDQDYMVKNLNELVKLTEDRSNLDDGDKKQNTKIAQLTEMVRVQSDKFSKIQQHFLQYKKDSQQLLECEKMTRDNEISDLKQKLEFQSGNKSEN
ncbi:hypothetical protein PPERSA_10862 [Pseudocohnilembus persalinus]|uniref:Uncharacterized protein n=1 Tax=Pseudocohnilembus persalinus TaxID=266149 RepID=A0A0V0QDZ0_PSEPJ|nr:hypothetical protein PPERSA_10862 [Pseudocohnilembus persalinus]|eukprot:KRX00363.1 hypothetical protein PPERSA_10862 [Pseudocohnilembus persalinus]